MKTKSIETQVFYRNDPSEVKALGQAVIPLAGHIKAVGHWLDRQALKKIIESDWFTEHEAAQAKSMLIRACKHVRKHLREYFPLMQADMLAQATYLEEVLGEYFDRFARAKEHGNHALSR